MRNQYVPMPRFIQDTPRGRMEWDPYSRLANDRIIFLGTPVDDTVANLIIAQLLILESEDPDKDVVMYVNSPGGEITGLFAIYDTMQYIKPDAAGLHVGLDVLHRVVDREPSGDLAAGRVDVLDDVFFRVVRLADEVLRHDEFCGGVVVR